MDVILDRYSLLRAPKQGPNINKLVLRERERLRAIFPGAVKRYRDVPHAIKNVARIAGHEMLHAYVIRAKRNDVARGLATIIKNQTVIHPQEGEFSGYDLDYWLSEGSHDDTHQSTAEAIVKETKKLALRYDGNTSSANPLTLEGGTITDVRVGLIVTTPVEGEEYNHGLHTVGRRVGILPIGAPTCLLPGEDDDPYGVTKVGQEVQLYHGELMFSKRQ